MQKKETLSFYEEEQERNKIKANSNQTNYEIIDNSFSITWNKLRFEIEDTIFKPREIISHCANRLCGIRETEVRNDNKLASTWPKFSKKRLIFKNLNGCIKSGELSAILGPSGAGKTSLLNALVGKTHGYGGQTNLICSSNEKRLKMSFIPQKDHLNELLTVEENLQFASRIKNIRADFNHNDNVERIIRMLNLSDCFHTRCSDISGGEYRRTSIGQELVSNPDLLVMDEPTSGLDSLSCKKLILCLKQLIEDCSKYDCKHAMAIVLTVHQPGPDIFHMFDNVYVMGQMGQVIYDGRPSEVVSLVSELIAAHCPAKDMQDLLDKKRNPAAFMIEIASKIYGQQPIDILSKYQEQQHHLKLLELASKSSNIYVNVTSDKIRRIKSRTTANSSDDVIKSHHLVVGSKLTIDNKPNSHYWYRLKLLTKREFQITYRDPFQLSVSVGSFALIPLIMSVIYSPKSGTTNSCPFVSREFYMLKLIDNNSDFSRAIQTQVENFIYSMEGIIMMSITCYAFSLSSLSVSVLNIPRKMHILIKEIRNGWYEQSGFITAKFLATFFLEAIAPMLSIMLAYKLTSHPSSYMEWRMISLSIMAAIISLISSCIGSFTGALLMDSPSGATLLGLGSTLPLIIVSGGLLRPKNMAPWLQYVSWGSFYRLALNAMISMRYGFNICDCNKQMEQYLNRVKPHFLDIPDNVQHMMEYFLNTSEMTAGSSPLVINQNETLLNRMAVQISKSLNMGSETDSCLDLVPQTMTALEVSDDQLPTILIGLTICFIIHRLLVHAAVNYQLRKRI